MIACILLYLNQDELLSWCWRASWTQSRSWNVKNLMYFCFVSTTKPCFLMFKSLHLLQGLKREFVILSIDNINYIYRDNNNKGSTRVDFDQPNGPKISVHEMKEKSLLQESYLNRTRSKINCCLINYFTLFSIRYLLWIYQIYHFLYTIPFHSKNNLFN